MSRLVPPEPGPARRESDDDARLLPLAQAYLAMRRRGVAAGPSLDAAWHAFHAATEPTIRALARAGRWPEADLPDGVQEVWVVLIRRLPDYRHDPERGRFRDWLFVVTRRTLANLKRGRRPREAPGPAGTADPAGREEDPASAAERAECVASVRAALAAADDAAGMRAALLYWAEGRPAREVAAELGLSEGQLWGLLRRVRRDLAARLVVAAGEAHGEPPGDS
jgi:RNA polymerase sigma factor (sigma-70 family)